MLRRCLASTLWFMLFKTTTSYVGCRGLQNSPAFRWLRSHIGDDPVQGVDLSPLVCVTTDGSYLSSRIRNWLDMEYLPQEIHSKLGWKVQVEYKKLRETGVSDLGEVLIGLGTSLESFDMENAFVNGWDIANKASELLIGRLDKLDYQSALTASLDDTAHLESVVLTLSSGFECYRMLQRYLEGEIPYEGLHSVLGFLLGFRVVQTPQGARFLQQPQLAPLRWEGLLKVPYFEDTEDMALGGRLAADLPDDAGSVDVVLESLVGMELYGDLRNSTEPAVQRRVLIAKWMYIQGFLNNDFPAHERYVPAHLQRELEDT